MPIYQYKCSDCNHQQEHLHKMSDLINSCPQCFGTKYTKQVSAPGTFQLLGGGYYETDFKNKPQSCGNNCSCH